MTPENFNLFEIRINERGKRYIVKFAAITYTMLVLVIFEATIALFWNIKFLAMNYGEYVNTLYDRIYPYISIVATVLSIISNVLYLRFPRRLLRAINNNDEYGANQAFSLLFKGALVFLIWLLLITANLIWSLTTRPIINF
jgi:hypothetical protein